MFVLMLIMFPFIRFMDWIKPDWQFALGTGGNEGGLGHLVWLVPAGAVCWLLLFMGVVGLASWLVPSGMLFWFVVIVGESAVAWWVVYPIFS